MNRNYRLSPLLLLAIAFPAATRVEASEIRDRAGMFSPEAVKKAQSELDQIERRTRIPVVIETIDSIPGLEKSAPNNARRKAIDELAVSRMEKERDAGVYLLISRRDRVLSNVLVRSKDAARLPEHTRIAIFNDLLDHFKEKRFDEGLLGAVAHLERSLTASPGGRVNGRVPAAPVPGGRADNVHGARFGVGSLLMIGLGIFAVLILLRALGGLFGRSSGGYSSPMGMGGMPRPGMGPGPGGYGQPGYGGYGAPRGGGFFSGMLGGLGGALAGNWLYDQFSGRHGSPGQMDAGSYTPTESTPAYDPAGDAPVGADDTGGMGGSWDDPGTADTGGDWSGGDGGADWGGGGGDWGGGGGDGGDW